MSAGRDWLSTAAAASDKASDTPVPEATEVSTSACKHRKKDGTLYKSHMISFCSSKRLQNIYIFKWSDFKWPFSTF